MDPLVIGLALGILLVGILAARAIRRHLLRQQAYTRIGHGRILRRAEKVPMTVLLHRTGPILGMKPGKEHAVRANLAVSDDRFILACDKGVLVDLGPRRGRMLSDVRATPSENKLVLEGTVSSMTGPDGTYVLSLRVPDAEGWVQTLQHFTQGRRSQLLPEAPTINAI